MGIFMITISQISSHTMARVYPRLSARNRGLELSPDQLPAVAVVLRDVERRPRPPRLDPANGCDPHGQPGEHFVDLGVFALVDADPPDAGGRVDPGVGERASLSVAAEDVQAGIEELAAEQVSGRTTAPGRLVLAERVDPPIARVDRLATGVGESQAFTEDAEIRSPLR